MDGAGEHILDRSPVFIGSSLTLPVRSSFVMLIVLPHNTSIYRAVSVGA